MSQPDPDLALVGAVQSGNEPAFNALMQRHQKTVHRFIYRHLQNESDAEELTQETFVRAFLKIGSFSPRARFSTWLFQIALNLCRDRSRSKAWRQATVTFSVSDSRPGTEASDRLSDTDLRGTGATPDENAMRREDLRRLESAIRALPHKLRSALVLTAVEGRSQAEAAELLHTTVKGVETRLCRARSLLAKALDAQAKKV